MMYVPLNTVGWPDWYLRKSCFSYKTSNPGALVNYEEHDSSVASHRQCSYLEHGCNCDFSCLSMHPDGVHAAAGEYGPSAGVIVFNVYTMDVVAELGAPHIVDEVLPLYSDRMIVRMTAFLCTLYQRLQVRADGHCLRCTCCGRHAKKSRSNL